MLFSQYSHLCLQMIAGWYLECLILMGFICRCFKCMTPGNEAASMRRCMNVPAYHSYGITVSEQCVVNYPSIQTSIQRDRELMLFFLLSFLLSFPFGKDFPQGNLIVQSCFPCSFEVELQKSWRTIMEESPHTINCMSFPGLLLESCKG